MNIIKTELRNKTGDEWLNHRMVCYIERDIFASIEDAKILSYLQHIRTRKINLPQSTSTYIIFIAKFCLVLHCNHLCNLIFFFSWFIGSGTRSNTLMITDAATDAA